MNITHFLSFCSKNLKRTFCGGIKQLMQFFIDLITNSKLLYESFVSLYFLPSFIAISIYALLVIINCENVFIIAYSIFLLIMIVFKIVHKNNFFHTDRFSITFLIFWIVNLSFGNNNFSLIFGFISLIAFHKEKTVIIILFTFQWIEPIPFLDEISSILIITICGFNFLGYSKNISEKFNQKAKLNFLSIIESNINIVPVDQDKASNAYFAGIVHDLRNPVGAVTNTFESLMESSRINNEERNNIQSALFCCKIQLMLINNLLDMSKIQANKFELNEEAFNLPKLILMIIKVEDHVCQRKKLILKRNILNTLPRVVLGDQNRITQILLNIIGNSVKFTSQGFVKISCAWLKRWDSINFSDQSMKDSLFINRKRDSLSLDFTNKKKVTTFKIEDEFIPASEDIFDDSSIQQCIPNYYFKTKPLNSKDKFIKFTRANNQPSNLSYPEEFGNNENELFLKCKFLKTDSHNCLSAHTNYEGDKSKEIKINDFLNISGMNEYSNEGVLYIEVVDTGEGIKKEEQASLFKPFSQASSKAKSLGTGLGLWISMKLIEIMGGKMKMFSEYGRGTVTKIAIPLKILKFNTLLFIKESINDKIYSNIDPKCSPEVQRHSERQSNSFQVYIFAHNISILKKLFPLESKLKENFTQVFFFFEEYSKHKKINYNFNNVIKRTIFLFIISEDSEAAMEEINNIQKSNFNSQVQIGKEIYALVKKGDKKIQELLEFQRVNNFLYEEINFEFVLNFLNSIISNSNSEIILNSGFTKGADILKSFEFNAKEYSKGENDNNLDPTLQKIMIVDDDIFAMDALAKMIKNLQNIEILEANNGIQAIELYKEHHNELFMIFIDKSMEPLDGIETSKAIRDFEAKEKIRPVIIIGISGDPDMDLFLKEGANEFFQKPVNSIIVNQVIDKYKSKKSNRKLTI